MTLLKRFLRWLNPPEEAATLPIEPAKEKGQPFKFALHAAAMMEAEGKSQAARLPFELPTAAPGVVTKDVKMAVDSACMGPNGLYNYANEYASFYEEGQTFFGFPVLAYMSVRSEYRRPSEILANELTRNWGKVEFTGDKDDKDEGIAERMEVMESELGRLNAQEIFRKAMEQDGLFGGSQVFLDMGNTDNVPELAKPLALTTSKIRKDSLKALTVIEPMWSYPNIYNAMNPLAPDYYKPQTWYIMNMQVHSSRLLSFVSRELPDILKPAYSFRGLSLTQLMKPYVDNWLQTRQSVNEIIQKFRTTVLATDLDVATMAGAESSFARVKMFAAGRTNSGVLLIDKTAEEFQDVTASLASLDKLQAQAQEHMATPPGIPLVVLFGITPSGLNATAEPEMQAFYERLSSTQESVLTPQMKRLLDVIQMSKFGAIDPQIGWKWNPLKHMDAKEKADIDLVKAQADSARIADGVIDPSEAREAIAHDEDGPYPGLDLNYTPEVPDPDSSGGANEPERGEEKGS